MIAKIMDNTGELDLTELTGEGLKEAKNQAEQLIQDIENEINNREASTKRLIENNPNVVVSSDDNGDALICKGA